MKKSLVFIFVFVFGFSLLMGGRVDAWKINALMHIGLRFGDWGITQYGLNHGFREGNWLAKHVMHSKPLSLAFTVGLTAGTILLLSKIENKVLKNILLCAVNLAIGFTIASNVRKLRS